MQALRFTLFGEFAKDVQIDRRRVIFRLHRHGRNRLRPSLVRAGDILLGVLCVCMHACVRSMEYQRRWDGQWLLYRLGNLIRHSRYVSTSAYQSPEL